jgi:hypothetical protein
MRTISDHIAADEAVDTSASIAVTFCVPRHLFRSARLTPWCAPPADFWSRVPDRPRAGDESRLTTIRLVLVDVTSATMAHSLLSPS